MEPTTLKSTENYIRSKSAVLLFPKNYFNQLLYFTSLTRLQQFRFSFSRNVAYWLPPLVC